MEKTAFVLKRGPDEAWDEIPLSGKAWGGKCLKDMDLYDTKYNFYEMV